MTTSAQGKPALIYKGYKYRLQRILNNSVRWACSTKKSCNAHLHTVDGVIVKETGEHFHFSKFFLKREKNLEDLEQTKNNKDIDYNIGSID